MLNLHISFCKSDTFRFAGFNYEGCHEGIYTNNGSVLKKCVSST
nr:MAG TPA: hypothetical protein [Caudoviricetes sp.]